MIMRLKTDTPSRVLPLKGVQNFRDLGGYGTRDGRTVRWRRLFRSGVLTPLTPGDLALLRELGVRHSYDLREPEERALLPYDHPFIDQHPCPVRISTIRRLVAMQRAGERLTVAGAIRMMQEIYEELVDDAVEGLTRLFEHLLDVDGPVVFHCRAGKDRTGLAAALLLQALGVPWETVMEDFLLSNRMFKRQEDHPMIEPDAHDVLASVRAEDLEAAARAIESRHGGLQAYLERRLRLTPAARRLLEQRYLEPAA
jgi:protein-tyrosine phosphatase